MTYTVHCIINTLLKFQLVLATINLGIVTSLQAIQLPLVAILAHVAC